MNNSRLIKYICAAFIICISMLNLTSCGKGDDYVFNINGEKIDSKMVNIFGLIYATEHNMADRDKLDDLYENGRTYEEFYKQDLEQDITLTVLLLKEAEKINITLSDEDKETVQKRMEAVFEKYGEGFMSARNIEQSDVEKILEWKILGDKYASEIGADDGNAEDNVRYIRVYQVTFPTASLDSDGMVQTDSEGNIIQITQSEIREMKEKADDFLQHVKDGQDIEQLLKEEPDTVTGAEKTLKYDDLSEDYKKEVDSLSEDEVGGVIEGDYGYYIVKLLDKNDEEHAKLLGDYESQTAKGEERKNLYRKLFNTYIGNNMDYRNDEEWEKTVISSYLP